MVALMAVSHIGDACERLELDPVRRSLLLSGAALVNSHQRLLGTWTSDSCYWHVGGRRSPMLNV